MEKPTPQQEPPHEHVPGTQIDLDEVDYSELDQLLADNNKELMSFGGRLADKITAAIGSWRFLIAQFIFYAAWIALNTVTVVWHWDPYPFILLNLVLSFAASANAPVLLISANRQAAKDRAIARNDLVMSYRDFRQGELTEQQVSLILAHIAAQQEAMNDIIKRLQNGRSGNDKNH